jgi:hypothetical protein
MKYSIIIPSHNLLLAQQAKNCLLGFDVTIFNGTGYPSFSKLINDCIISSPEEVVIIVNHKIRATPLHIYKMIHLINKGFGLVGLQNFHFFGFKKDLIRKIGFFDERYIGGGCEDSDLVRRIIENRIAWWDSTETPVIQIPSAWNSSKALEFHHKKWKNGTLERLLPDEKYNYDIGEYKGSQFLGLENTVLSKSNLDYFNSINFKFK